MIATKVEIDAGGARDRPCGALIPRHLCIEHTGRDQPIEMTVAVLEPVEVFRDVLAQQFQRLAQPGARLQVAP